jgi:hypothetical protein
MSNKKKTAVIPSTNAQTLKIGSRARCTDDSVEGRIVWANAVSLKIKWDDGEEVTWRRDTLAERPIEILTEPGDEDQSAGPLAAEALVSTDPIGPPPAEPEEAAPVLENPVPDQIVAEQPVGPAMEPTSVEQSSTPSTEPTETPAAIALGATSAADMQAEDSPPSEPSLESQPPLEQTAEQPDTNTEAIANKPRTRRPKAAEAGKEKRLSALDAAAKILCETGLPMNCQEMIEQMALKRYWTSPGGKTPHATLYSVILTEIITKGNNSRFAKFERGKFTRTAVV